MAVMLPSLRNTITRSSCKADALTFRHAMTPKGNGQTLQLLAHREHGVFWAKFWQADLHVHTSSRRRADSTDATDGGNFVPFWY
mmetsp:Transcript_568/g.1106  ORF Transcript_568/g.1106 Transcript_568/m.1106 type:complete len:84 (-) Transcript_568:77-328(-)